MSNKFKKLGKLDKINTDRKNYRPRVYVVGGGFEYISLLYRLNFDGARGLEDADIVLFTGGEDVSPSLYGERTLSKTYCSPQRDTKEEEIYKLALEKEIPMVGICRGGQFLNVMNGGRLWQDVNNHGRSHKAYIHIPPFVLDQPRELYVTSTHHQMMIPTDEALVLMVANESNIKTSAGKHVEGATKTDPDVEAVFYDGTNCLCFQPHPEFPTASAELVDFFEECMDNFIVPNIPLSATAKAIIDQIPKAITKKSKPILTVPKVKITTKK